MNQTEKELMSRYVYEVVRRVPKEQQEEIQMELEELIGDMYETDDEGNMEKILMQLGDPAEFAKKYREDVQCLISPEYYDDYIWVMKIVLISIAASAVLSAIVQTGRHLIRTSQMRLSGINIEDTVIGLLVAFGIVTIVFAVLERQKVKLDIREKEKWTTQHLSETGKGIDIHRLWSPKQLPPIPDKRGLISRGDCIASLIFIVIFAGILTFMPTIFGLTGSMIGEGSATEVVPLFNMDYWNVFLPILLSGLGVGFVEEIIKLFTGKYCKVVVIANTVSSIVQIGIGVLILKILPFWNVDFAAEVQRTFGVKLNPVGDILAHIGTDFVSNLILAIIVISTLLELGTTVYKTIRYGAAV